MSVIAYNCPEITVTVVDSDSEKIKAWNGPLDDLPIYEKGLVEIVKMYEIEIYFSHDISRSIEKAE